MNNAVTSSPGAGDQPPRSRRGGVILFGALALVGIGLLAVFYYGILNPPSRRASEGLAPDFQITTYDGEAMALSDFRGTPVVLNFWASWCVPCRDEQPLLQAYWQRYQGEVVFLGLNYLDQRPNALAYLAEFGVTYPNGPDMGSRIYSAYRVQGVPETFFIDAAGQVQGVHVGPMTARDLEQRISQLLNPTF
ncbi:MAG: redoxin domain-containing protein [Caldilineales bacterium]|nr:redoxin domain-containing protein [Caldilineales bacterium]